VDADPLAGLRAGLRGEVDALVVAPLPEQTAIWLVTDDRVIVGSSAVDRAELEALATSLEQALSVAPGEDDETPWDIPSRALYDAVIGPVEEALREHGVTRLAIAADPPLAAVPFAALRDDEQYLVQRMALWSLPPVEVPEGRGTDRSRSRRATLLLAADGWERTEAAARMRYRTTTVVRGEALDRSAWEVALPLADVAVMGLPVEASGVLPTAARLRLVAADGGEDWLRLDGLGASTLSNRLQAWCVPVDPVVAPPLLEAGAGAVLLPSWDAGDEAAAALLTEVFKGLDRVGAGVALQLAQQARIRAGAPPREWAGWSLYEATSP